MNRVTTEEIRIMINTKDTKMYHMIDHITILRIYTTETEADQMKKGESCLVCERLFVFLINLSFI